MLDGLARVALAAEQNGVRTGRRTQGKLVKGEGLTARCEDASSGCRSEAESGNAELGQLGEAHVVGDGADDDDDLRVAVRRVGGLLDYFGEGDGRAVDFGEEETVKNGLFAFVTSQSVMLFSKAYTSGIDLVEGGVGTPCEESVQLNGEFVVIGLRSRRVNDRRHTLTSRSR